MANSAELSPNVVHELNDYGELIGIEVQDASAGLSDFVWNQCRLNCLLYRNRWHINLPRLLPLPPHPHP